MKILRYDSLASTNTEAARIADKLNHGDIIIARSQTSGRGQRGNSWEAEPGKNLTFSVFIVPEKLRAADSFRLSMAISLGIADALKCLLETEDIRIKWPNDIYWKNKKICGILIENSFCGTKVGHSIIGIGINVNQTEFLSDAPNPVSMAQIAGREFDLEKVLETVCGALLLFEMELTNDPSLVDRYFSHLWKNEHTCLWREPQGAPFHALIQSVEPSGHLNLLLSDGSTRSYAFKEVFPILGDD